MSFFTPVVPNRIGIAKRGRYGMRKTPPICPVAVSTSDIFDNLEVPSPLMWKFDPKPEKKKKTTAILSLP